MATELFAVVGKPVLHSKSPQMHNAAFRKIGIDAVYVRLAAESAEDALKTARETGMRGINVTSPFKEEFAKIVDAADQMSRKLGAVNTVIINGRRGDGDAKGYDTDPDGVSGALEAAGVELAGENAVVLGAGGAAKAAAAALLEKKARVTIANRTESKAKGIADMLGCGYCPLDGISGALQGASILISALSTDERVVPPALLKEGLAVLDANYSTETALARDSKKAGCKVIDGREWLLYQGARAFELFSGKKAPLQVMRKAAYALNAKPGMREGKLESGNLALVGMMGSGKNATAKALNKKSGMGIIDIDAEIERKAGKTISRIFASEGEEGFRKMESVELAAAARCRGKIINCGGGVVLKTQNRKTLNRHTTVVWLWAKPSIMAKRVAGDESRPLLNAPDHEKETILAKLLESRKRYYAESADLMIDTGGREPLDVAERILHEIH